MKERVDELVLSVTEALEIAYKNTYQYKDSNYELVKDLNHFKLTGKKFINIDRYCLNSENKGRIAAICIFVISSKTIETLIESNNIDIDCAIAGKSFGSIKVFKALTKHRSPEVRIALAENSNLTVELAEVLSKDPDERVRAIIADHFVLTTDAVKRLFINELSIKVRFTVIHSNYAEPDILSAYAKDDSDENEGVRWGIIHHKNVDDETLILLSNSKNINTAKTAIVQLVKRGYTYEIKWTKQVDK